MELLINNKTISNDNKINNNNNNNNNHIQDQIINIYNKDNNNNINNSENNNDSSNNETLITKIPREVWIHILSFLNEKDLLNVSFVDSFLYQISQDNFLWKPLYLKKWNVITLPHKKRISIDKNLNHNNKRMNTNKLNNNSSSSSSSKNNNDSNNYNSSNNNSNNISFNEFNEYYNSFNNNNNLFNNNNNNFNNNNTMYNNLFDNNFNNSYLNFNFNNVDNSINQNLNNFVQKIFKPKLNIYNINNNEDNESFMNHLPIWKSLYRERKLIVKEGGIEEFYHLLETLIAYPLEFNRKAMMTMYTIVFQLCIVNYRMMNYLLPPMDLYRMLIECCHNHLMKIYNESVLYEEGPQLVKFYLHHWNNYIHSIKRINIVFSYFHRDWISKQGEDIYSRTLSFNLKGANCWWYKMLHGTNTPTDPLSFVHLTTMMARGWYTVFFSQIQFDESDLNDLLLLINPNNSTTTNSPNRSNLPQQSQPYVFQFPTDDQPPQSIYQNQPTFPVPPSQQPYIHQYNNNNISNNNQSSSQTQTQTHQHIKHPHKLNRLFNALDKCREKNDYILVSNLLKSMLQLHEFLLHNGDESTNAIISAATTAAPNSSIYPLQSGTPSHISIHFPVFTPIYNILKTYNPHKNHCSRDNTYDLFIKKCNNQTTQNNQLINQELSLQQQILYQQQQQNTLYNFYQQQHQQQYSTFLYNNEIRELINQNNPFIQQGFHQFQQYQHNQQNNVFTTNDSIHSFSNNINNSINDNSCQFCNIFNSPPPTLCDEKMNKLLKKSYSMLLLNHISKKKF